MNSSPLKSQVVSLELSKRLKELGVPQKSIFYWHTFPFDLIRPVYGLIGDTSPKLDQEFEDSKYCYSAFLVGELISMLQDVAEDDIVVSVNDKTPANTLAEMLCTKLQSSKGNVGSGRTL